MTIATSADRNDYSGVVGTCAFAYTFKILANTSLKVHVAGVVKTLTTDYTVSGVGSASGGTVTFGTEPAAGALVSLVHDEPYTQATDWVENDPSPAATLEDAVDKLTMLIQQVKGLATRALRFAAGSVNAAAGITMPELVASKYLQVNATCDGFNLVALTATGTYTDPVTTKGDLIQGSTAGAQERLAVHTCDCYVLTVISGKAAWQPPALEVGKWTADLGPSGAATRTYAVVYQNVSGRKRRVWLCFAGGNNSQAGITANLGPTSAVTAVLVENTNNAFSCGSHHVLSMFFEVSSCWFYEITRNIASGAVQTWYEMDE